MLYNLLLKLSWLLNSYELRGTFDSCVGKPRYAFLLYYELLDKGTIKFEVQPYLSMAKRGYILKSSWRRLFSASFMRLKKTASGT
jgi:hypothetical protein